MKDRYFYSAATVLGLIAIALGAVASVPKARQAVRDLVLGDKRRILARADGQLDPQGAQVAVIKVLTNETLSLEVYEKKPPGEEMVFQKRLVLPEKRDGYFHFRGNATNLVLADVDDDGGLEIIAPTFDENLIPRLNVYKFEAASQSFFKLGPENLKF